MAQKQRTELNTDADTNLADNVAGDISAEDVRGAVKDLADSMVVWRPVPVAYNSAGEEGEAAADSDYLYIYIGGQWRRLILDSSTF